MKLLKAEVKIMEMLGLEDVKDLLFVFPYRYDHNELLEFKDWKVSEKVFFQGKLLTKPTVSYFGRRNSARFQVEYDENIINCTIFNRKWISNLDPGVMITIEGKYQGNNKVSVANYNTNNLEDNLGMIPVYRLSTGVTIAAYRKFVNKVFDHHIRDIIDDVPMDIRDKYRLLPLQIALKYIHFPKSQIEVDAAVRTLKYREFLLFNLSNQFINLETSQSRKLSKTFDSEEVFRLANSLDFHLTPDQFTSTREILDDLSSPKLMNRLLQGDVGSGKTVVAAIAVYANVLAGYQAAFMVPTEILAIQQHDYFKNIFKSFGLNVVCLYSSLKKYKKEVILEQIEDGTADIVIGTHSLIQDQIEFNKLGLVVIDEQQRFGVHQRSSLFEKGIKIDRLLMSATPIPRTMANVLFSNMDISTIRSKPKDRLPIITQVVKGNTMKPILNEVLALIDEGNQVYVVCPAIEEGEASHLSTVDTIYESLQIVLNERQNLDIKIGKLHGQLDSNEKEEVMKDFQNKNYDILVSTTVIEVGINVKSANVMVIYNANAFGLSQLHQLRGRVGRGSKQGYCFLLDGSTNDEGREKLEFMASTNDGFEISRYDLKLRGPGDVIGIRQSGIPNFVLGDLAKDHIMLEHSNKDAKVIINDLNNPLYRDIIRSVSKTNNIESM